MKARLWLGALTALAALGTTAALTAAPAKKAAAPAARNWATTVVATPEGGFRMGNPNARVKVVEFGSLTCPHCAEFSNSAKGALSAEVRKGTTSFEFRNFVLNGVDVSASLVARCAGTRGFFPMIEMLYATQKDWLGRIAAMTPAQQDQLQALPDNRKFARIAAIAGFGQVAARVGLTPQQTNACLADPAGLNRLVQMVQAGNALGVQGTPTFLVNGATVHAHSWSELLQAIRKAGG
jgi:protein-disulfide isomerase